MDGYEIAALIRARAVARVPIIFLTASTRTSCTSSAAIRAGAVDYVFKPIEPIV